MMTDENREVLILDFTKTKLEKKSFILTKTKSNLLI